MAAEQGEHGPIFIVGAMGSGTTLLRLILDSHENIAIPQETGIMRAALAHKWIPHWRFGDSWYGRLDLTEMELNEHLREFYDGLFMRYAAMQGKQRWGEKTPWHVWHIEEIVKIWPQAVFIGIVRHPGANAGSLQRRFSFALPRALYHWRRYNLELVRHAAEVGPRMVFCRYEDLVLQTEPLMRELLEWLDEPWSSAVLEHHVIHRDRGTPTNVEGRTRSDQPIAIDRVDRWAGTMSPPDRQLVTSRAGSLAEFFGYSCDAPDVYEPIVPSDSSFRWLVTGDQMSSRRDRAGLPDFDAPPPVPLADRQLRPQRLELRTVAPTTGKPASTIGSRIRRAAGAILPQSLRKRLNRSRV